MESKVKLQKALELRKSKYVSKKRGKDGKWIYEYDSKENIEKKRRITVELNNTFYSKYKNKWKLENSYETFIKKNMIIINKEVEQLKQTSNSIVDEKLRKKYYNSGMRDLKIQITTIWDSLKKIRGVK